MKTIIFTYDRLDNLTTPMFFEKDNIEHTILCQSEEDKNKFIAEGRVNPKKIIASGNPKGLGFNRNFALDMLQQDEWALFLVDDLKYILEYENYENESTENLDITTQNIKNWKDSFKKNISVKKFMERCEESIKKAEEENIKLVGFAGFNNPLFIKNKWKYNALADGRAWLIKKSNLRFDMNVQLVDDVSWSVININSGGVLINQWVIPDCRRYTAGAYGSKQKRMKQRISECKYLVQTYPRNLRFAEKAGWPPFSHIQIKHLKKYSKDQKSLF